mgnify:CR=1 FL=1
MIGLSLSFCIADIITGKVPLEDVELIITGTACRTPDHWESLLEQYKQTYWRYDESHVANPEQVLNYLLLSGKIYQPRLNDEQPPRIGRGHWVKDQDSLAKNRDCSECMERVGDLCPHEDVDPRKPVIPTYDSEVVSPYQLGCYYFKQR